MSTSQRTINQVRSILGRLDRSIDEARDRRLKGESPDAQKPARASTEVILPDDTDCPGRSAAANQGTASAPPPVGPARATPKPPSPFGRAKPLRKTGSDDAPTDAWKK